MANDDPPNDAFARVDRASLSTNHASSHVDVPVRLRTSVLDTRVYMRKSTAPGGGGSSASTVSRRPYSGATAESSSLACSAALPGAAPPPNMSIENRDLVSDIRERFKQMAVRDSRWYLWRGFDPERIVEEARRQQKMSDRYDYTEDWDDFYELDEIERNANRAWLDEVGDGDLDGVDPSDRRYHRSVAMPEPRASLGEILGTVEGCGSRCLLAAGLAGAAGSGAVFPLLVWLTADALRTLSVIGAWSSPDAGVEVPDVDPMAGVVDVATSFLYLGALAFVANAVCHGCLEVVSSRAGRACGGRRFRALLRQDRAWSDVVRVDDATDLPARAEDLRRALGRGLGVGASAFARVVGCAAAAFAADWRIATAVAVAAAPSGRALRYAAAYRARRGPRAQQAYATARAVARQTLERATTVAALNAATEATRQYDYATERALRHATRPLFGVGVAHGVVWATLCAAGGFVALIGSWLIRRNVQQYGCDPTGGVERTMEAAGLLSGDEDHDMTCPNSATNVLIAVLGIAFAYQGVEDTLEFFSAVQKARAAVYPCTIVSKRDSENDDERVVYQRLDNHGTIVISKEKEDKLKAKLNKSKGKAIKKKEKQKKKEREEEAKENENEDENDRRRAGNNDDQYDLEDESDLEAGDTVVEITRNARVESTDDDDDDLRSQLARHKLPLPGNHVRRVLPAYRIDPTSPKGERPQLVRGDVALENVRFAYPDAPRRGLLDGLDLVVRAGTTVALVPIDANDASDERDRASRVLSCLLTRTHDPARGRVALDGIDLRDWNVSRLRQIVGTVRLTGKKGGVVLGKDVQVSDDDVGTFRSGDADDDADVAADEPLTNVRHTLFTTSVARNIAGGDPLRTTPARIEEVSKRVGLHRFVRSLPRGYNTVVNADLWTPRRIQQLVLARALVKDPRVLVVSDEREEAEDGGVPTTIDASTALTTAAAPTTAVDALLDRVAGVAEDRAVLFVTSDLSIARRADVVAVLDDGRVVETGSHEELMVADDDDDEVEDRDDDHRHHRVKGAYRELVLGKERAKSTTSESVKGGGGGEEETDDGGGTMITEDFPPSTMPPPPPSLDGIYRSSSEGNTNIIRFKDVSFSYHNKKVFRNMSLNIRRGETLALVGPKGSGKKTILSLIQRLYDPSAGVVQYDGKNIKKLNVAWYRDQIGAVVSGRRGGKEPVLFNASVGTNITYGFEEATAQKVEEVARAVDLHQLLETLPDGYRSRVDTAPELQHSDRRARLAAARALVRDPKILLWDEAVGGRRRADAHAAERDVRSVLRDLSADPERTTVIVAARLSTARAADRVAYVADGAVREIGTHDELVATPMGRYAEMVRWHRRRRRRRGESPDRIAAPGDASTVTGGVGDGGSAKSDRSRRSSAKEDRLPRFDLHWTRTQSRPVSGHLFAGSVGTCLAGVVFPLAGFLFGVTMRTIFAPVLPCDDDDEDAAVIVPFGFETCQAYHEHAAKKLQDDSYVLAASWLAIVVCCLVGNLMAVVGFGQASAQLSKRIRDDTFHALCRQEAAFFDTKTVEDLTSRLEHDATKFYTFLGEPIRRFAKKGSSVLLGVVISFMAMWPFALVSLVIVPLNIMGRMAEKKLLRCLEEGNHGKESGTDTPSFIVKETLLNMETVSSFNMEAQRYKLYVEAWSKRDEGQTMAGIKTGLFHGLTVIMQQYFNALRFWWAGWLLSNYSGIFSFGNLMVSFFSLLFSLAVLGTDPDGGIDKKDARTAASRIHQIIKRKSKIDPLNKKGKKLMESTYLDDEDEIYDA